MKMAKIKIEITSDERGSGKSTFSNEILGKLGSLKGVTSFSIDEHSDGDVIFVEFDVRAYYRK